MADVFTCVAQTRRRAADVVERLGHLGYRTPELSGAAEVTDDDIDLLHPLGDHHGWLTPGAVLSVPQISYSAARAGVSPADAAVRLGQLGYHDRSTRTEPCPGPRETRRC
ncbi:hypothetical protein [Streptomyces sp. NPDC005322]|uniref:wHTH domain-containing protein n=1 Tax=unclassified Streptomyces TaxID=2593676 RepID=UPI0033BDCEB4